MMTSGAPQHMLNTQQQYQVPSVQPAQVANPVPLMSQTPQFGAGSFTQPQVVQQPNTQPAEQYLQSQPAAIPQLMQTPVQNQSVVDSGVPVGGEQMPQYQQYSIPQQQVRYVIIFESIAH